jgi:hypothetical protein
VSEYLGTGPDGQNLLGFLSAVGTFAVMELRWPGRHPRMRWEMRECWRPVWSLDGELSDDELIGTLYEELLARGKAPEFIELGDRLPAPSLQFAEFARSVAADATSIARTKADFAVAFGCEAPAVRDKMQDAGYCAPHHEYGAATVPALDPARARSESRGSARSAVRALALWRQGAGPTVRPGR